MVEDCEGAKLLILRVLDEDDAVMSRLDDGRGWGGGIVGEGCGVELCCGLIIKVGITLVDNLEASNTGLVSSEAEVCVHEISSSCMTMQEYRANTVNVHASRQEPITQREGALNLCMYADSTCCQIALAQHSLYGKCYVSTIIYLALV